MWGAPPERDTGAGLSNGLYTQLRPGPPLDGVLYADPSAFAALLEITGPVPVPTTGVTLTADNAEDFLTKGQFAALPESSHAIDQVIRSTLNTFTSKKLPAPRVLGRVLAPVVDEGRLQFASLHERDRPLLDRLGLSGSVARHGEDDLLAVVNRNANPSKIDAYLRRDVRYDVRWNPATGQTTARVTVRLTNDLPAGPLPDVVTQAPGGVPPGTNRTQLSVLSPLTVHAAAVDGERAGVGTQQEYAGVLRHSMLVDVPAGATREVTFDLEGPLAIGRYELQWYGQPLVDRGHVRIRIQQVGPELPPGVRPVTRVFPADEDHTVRVVASPV